MEFYLAIAGELPCMAVCRDSRKTTRRYPRRFADESAASGVDGGPGRVHRRVAGPGHGGVAGDGPPGGAEKPRGPPVRLPGRPGLHAREGQVR